MMNKECRKLEKGGSWVKKLTDARNAIRNSKPLT